MRFSFLARAVLLSLVLVSSLFRPVTSFARDWNKSGNVTNDFKSSGNWNGGAGAPTWGDQLYVTNAPSVNETNIAGITGDQTGWDVLVVSNRNGSSGGFNKVLVNTGHTQGDFLRVGQNGIVEVGNTASLTIWRGTTLSSGGAIILNNATFNYGGEVENHFRFSGDFIANNSGTFNGTASGAHDAIEIQSGGRLIANGGTFILYVANASGFGGVTIQSGGQMIATNGGTIKIDMWTGAGEGWNKHSPTNNGTILLVNGTITSGDTFAQNASRFWINNGTILGAGTVATSIKQSSTGQTIASNGVLSIFGSYTGGQATFTAVSGSAFGVFKAVSGGTLKVVSNVVNGVGGSWIVDNGGTLEIATIASGLANNVDLTSAFMQGANFNGTVKVNAGANLTFSSAAAGSALLSQNGTFEFVASSGAGNVPSMNMPGVSGLNTFTNNGVFLLSGSASGSASWNGGAAGNSYAFVNAGKIELRNGGTLIINTADATTTGFSNTTAGTIVITNNSQTVFRINRTTTGWGGDTPVNMGTMILSNAIFQTAENGSAAQSRLFRNVGTILVLGGNANTTNFWVSTLQNAGTILLTNNNAVLNIGTTTSGVGLLTNTATGRIFLGTNGAVGMLVATNVGSFANQGTIQGQGTITLGRDANGANASLRNSGVINATNYSGGATAGTLTINTGNAFSNGGFGNLAGATNFVGTNMTFVINRTSTAWAGSGGLVTNAGYVYLLGGTFTTSSDGVTDTSAVRTNLNTGTITGWGTYNWLVTNQTSASILADARAIANRNTGTLTVSLLNNTNSVGNTLGAIGTNSVLNLLLPGGNGFLINFGTVQFSAGKIVLNGTTGTISNFFAIAGVGDLSSLPIVQAGNAASLIAKDPTDGSNNLVATVGSINTAGALFGTVSNANGIATLQLTLAGGANVLSNAGTIAIQGGLLTVNGTSGIISNNGIIYGFGGLSNNVANLSGGTILASNGTFRVGLLNNFNAGVLTNFDASSTLVLTNTILVNTSKIFLSGGGLIMNGSVITNQGTITGPGQFSSGLYNDTNGTVVATGGTLAIATNGPATEAVVNAGTVTIANGATFQVGGTSLPVDWNNITVSGSGTGQIVLAGSATVIGGILTNAGTISGNGSINNNGLINAAGGTITIAGGNLLNVVRGWTNLAGTVVLTSGTLTNGGLRNTGTILVSTGGGTISVSTFNNASAGTIVVSNGVNFFLNTAGLNNAGTILLDATGGATIQTNSFNYGQIGAAMTNAGTVVKTSTGFSEFNGSFGGNNFAFVNTGTLIAGAGTLVVNSANAFNVGGFSNTIAGTIAVSNGATFVINRNGSAWDNAASGLPVNLGTISMAGGTITLQYSGAQSPDRTNVNQGTIIGSGTIAMAIQQGSTGQTIASNGVLNIFQSFGANQQTFTSLGGQYGVMSAVAGGNLKINGNIASGNAASWAVGAGGTVEVAGVNADLGAAFMPGSQLNGTIKINTGGNLTLSGATGISGQTLQQNGTFDIAGGSVFMPNVAGLSAFTNGPTGYIILSSGNGSFVTGVDGGNTYGVVNRGTIMATTGGTLLLNASDATNVGFSNAPTGTIIVSGGSRLRIRRTATGWGGDTAANAGTIILNGGTLQTADGGGVSNVRLIRNLGTIFAQGTGTATNTWEAALENRGTLYITNNTAIFNLLYTPSAAGISLTNTSTGQIFLGGINGAVGTLQATNLGSNGRALVNQGLIQGQGTINLGVTNSTGGFNANFINVGDLIVTNWGHTAGGQLFITTGNAFSNGGFSNTAAGTISIASNATLTVNRSQNAWAGSGNSVANLGTINLAGGSLNLASDGVVSNAASFINSGTISGWGTIDSVVITTNNGKVFANATNLVNEVGTLTLRIASTTNNSSSTLGTIGTNSVLNLIAPGGQNVLINFGTVSLSGGTINFSGGAGTITNFFVVAGVGNLSSFGVVNTGALASVIAQAPIAGLSNLIASVGVTNSAILGANNLFGAAATLTLGTSTDGGLVNNGTLAIQGGFVTVTNAAGVDAGVTNLTGQIYGYGTQTLAVANLAGGSIVASNGILSLGLQGNLNQGLISNFNASSTIRLTNSIVVNASGARIALNGGGFVMAGSIVTNQGTITGPGSLADSLFNDTGGFVAATNGTLILAANGATEKVENLGTFDIASASTLNVSPAWNNTNGTVFLHTGTLSGGAVTNKGIVLGDGTITANFINAAEGTLKATNGNLNVRASTVVQSGTMIGGSIGGPTIVITNTSSALRNTGTMILDSPLGGPTNVAFLVLRATSGSFAPVTNAASGLIQGAGFFSTGDGITGGRNFALVNEGTILATNGTLVLNPSDAFNFGGFVNTAGGTVIVANASTLGLQRTLNAWDNGPTNPANLGLIRLNGGSVALYTNSTLVDNTRYLSNGVTGVISGFGTIMGSVVNLGTLAATNGTLYLNNGSSLIQTGTIRIADSATFTILGSAGSFQNNNGGQVLLAGGTFVGTNFAVFRNAGTISGFGTITAGRLSGTGGANQNIVNFNSGFIIATNGTLFLNPGDAFTDGGFSNSLSGTVRIENGGTLILNRTANAWNNYGVFGNATNSNPKNRGTIELRGGEFQLFSDGALDRSRFIENVDGRIQGFGTISGSLTNFGTIGATNGLLVINGTGRFRQAGTLSIDAGGTLRLTNTAALAGISFTNEANILMRGGELQAGVIANTNIIFGFGIISGAGVDNSGRLLASNGVLVAALSSFTNGTTATLGTLSTNATLDVTIPGGAGQPLINRGTINLAGGNLLFNGSDSGTISNRTTGTILGVGNVTQTVVNDGTIMAANPVSGLSIFSVGLSDLNSATIGASNGATLNIVLSGGTGSSFNNNGSISMLGGRLVISNATPGLITNNLWITGTGTITPAIVNNSTIVANVNGGTLDVTLLGGTNTAWMRAGAGAVLQVQNSFVNLGTIGADGANGGTVMVAQATGIMTNRGTGYLSSDSSGISGLTIKSLFHNVDGGTVVATNGTLTFAAANGLFNSNATIRISTSGTLQSNSSNSWRNAGSIDLRGGTLRTGGHTNAAFAAAFTNTGTINGYGTIIGGGAYGTSGADYDKSIINLGTIVATNPISGTAQTLFITTGSATADNGIHNLGTIIVASNNTLSLNRGAGLPILNTGTITIQNGTLTGSGVLSNTSGGIIQGYGTLSHAIVNLGGGTIRATNGLMTMTSTVFPVNEGTFQITAGSTMTWNTSNSWRNAGTIDLRGGTLRTGGHTQAFETAVFSNSNTIVGFGTIYGGGAFNTNGVGIDKSIVNEGTVIASGGTLILDTGVATSQRGLANLGTMIIASTNDTLVLSRTAEISGSPGFVTNLNFLQNSGTIIINGGTLTSRTAITNQNEGVGLPGLIEGFGHIALTNRLANLGTIRSTNNVVGGDGVLHFVNPVGSALQITQNGTLVVELGSQMIFGANTNAPLANGGTILMRGGFLRSGVLTNSSLARILGFGTITSDIINSGTLLANGATAPLHLTGSTVFNRAGATFGATSGRLIVDTVFTNAGTVSFLNSVGTFNAAVVNEGAWVMDPSTNVFYGNFTVATNGYITMTRGDVSVFKSNFYNTSYLSNQYNTVAGKFVFDGDDGLPGTYTQRFYVAGLDLGGNNLAVDGTPSETNSFSGLPVVPIFGYTNNFALGALQIGSLTSTSTLMLLDTFGALAGQPDDGRVAGLYVNTFTINPGSLLIVSSNVEFYFKSSNGVSGVSLGTLNPGDNVLILEGGSFHQLNIIPEPSILMLFVIGSVAIYWRRRRK